MHLSHIPQCIFENRNVHISVLNGVLWDTGQVHCCIRETVLFWRKSLVKSFQQRVHLDLFTDRH